MAYGYIVLRPAPLGKAPAEADAAAEHAFVGNGNAQGCLDLPREKKLFLRSFGHLLGIVNTKLFALQESIKQGTHFGQRRRG